MIHIRNSALSNYYALFEKIAVMVRMSTAVELHARIHVMYWLPKSERKRRSCVN